jgi:hypothetical protein
MDKAVTYAFLSAIKEKAGNITSLLSIFIEMVENLLAILYRDGMISGLFVDLQFEFQQKYAILIPLPTLRTILFNISKKYDDSFAIYNDNSFVINNFPSIDLSNMIDQQEQDVNEIFDLYVAYLDTHNLENASYPLLDYIEQNKLHIVKYLAGETDFESNFTIQARFLKKVINIPIYGATINRIFLGSIISAYVELEIDDSTTYKKTLLLDTNFIVSLLNLHSLESYANCKMLVEIAHQLNYKIEIMLFTVKETQALLNRVAERMEKDLIYYQSVDRDTIYHGCFRNNISANNLSIIAQKFVDTLREKYSIFTTDEGTDSAMINEARQSQFYADLKNRTNNPDGALHDATVLYYTKRLRKNNPHSFNDIDAWFVTDTKGVSENKRAYRANAPLIIRSEELLNIIWLSHPLYNDKTFARTLLAKTLSGTLSECLPNKEMLKAMDKKLQVIKDYPINTADCVKVAEVIGSLDNQQLKIFTEKKTQEEFIADLQHLSAIATKIEEDEKLKDNEFVQAIQVRLAKSKEREVEAFKKLKDNEMQHFALESKNKSAEREIALIQEVIQRDEDEINSITREIIEPIQSIAEKSTKRIMITIGVIGIVLCIPISILTYKFWNQAEPLFFIISFAPLWISYFVVGVFFKSLSLNTIRNFIVLRFANRARQKNMRFIDKVETLKKQVSVNTQRVETLKQSMIFY